MSLRTETPFFVALNTSFPRFDLGIYRNLMERSDHTPFFERDYRETLTDSEIRDYSEQVVDNTLRAALTIRSCEIATEYGFPVCITDFNSSGNFIDTIRNFGDGIYIQDQVGGSVADAKREATRLGVDLFDSKAVLWTEPEKYYFFYFLNRIVEPVLSGTQDISIIDRGFFFKNSYPPDQWITEFTANWIMTKMLSLNIDIEEDKNFDWMGGGRVFSTKDEAFEPLVYQDIPDCGDTKSGARTHCYTHLFANVLDAVRENNLNIGSSKSVLIYPPAQSSWEFYGPLREDFYSKRISQWKNIIYEFTHTLFNLTGENKGLYTLVDNYFRKIDDSAGEFLEEARLGNQMNIDALRATEYLDNGLMSLAEEFVGYAEILEHLWRYEK